ncbi:MAG: FumA C-terminus/TtdB family hydratase beta subunit [Kiritimatiellaeota bacterium]|nr:FumA C-terminus/TtdB family hydratase beta subunit [Kiritimatiellota bacterium]
MRKLHIPLSTDVVRELQVGDEVSLSGTIVTGRDAAHTWLLEAPRTEVAVFLKDSLIYHCGPVVSRSAAGWSFVAAGPTTSIREEPYQAEVIKNYGLRGVIGKGGMGPKTLAALQAHGAAYFHAVGGLAALLAQAVTQVRQVFMLEEFGIPEALWVIAVQDFRAVVTMDAHGNSWHDTIRQRSEEVARQLLQSRRSVQTSKQE